MCASRCSNQLCHSFCYFCLNPYDPTPDFLHCVWPRNCCLPSSMHSLLWFSLIKGYLLKLSYTYLPSIILTNFIVLVLNSGNEQYLLVVPKIAFWWLLASLTENCYQCQYPVLWMKPCTVKNVFSGYKCNKHCMQA